jgi:hypothetical protein
LKPSIWKNETVIGAIVSNLGFLAPFFLLALLFACLAFGFRLGTAGYALYLALLTADYMICRLTRTRLNEALFRLLSLTPPEDTPALSLDYRSLAFASCVYAAAVVILASALFIAGAEALSMILVTLAAAAYELFIDSARDSVKNGEDMPLEFRRRFYVYSYAPDEGFGEYEIASLGIFEPFLRLYSSDMLEASLDGEEFATADLALYSELEGVQTRIFNGFVLRLEHELPVTDRLLVSSIETPYLRKEGMIPVRAGRPSFDYRFSACCDSAEGGAEMLTPALSAGMDRLAAYAYDRIIMYMTERFFYLFAASPDELFDARGIRREKSPEALRRRAEYLYELVKNMDFLRPEAPNL